MDVRLSAEQQALRDAAAHVVDRLGPETVPGLDDTERVGRLDAAVVESGWRELRTAVDGGGPLASGVEVALVAEELGRGVADVAYLGPTLAAELRRLAGAPAVEDPETVVLDHELTSLAVVAADGPSHGVAVDAAGSSHGLVLTGSGDGHRLARVALGPARPGLDLTRPSASPDPAAAATEVDGAAALSDEDLTSWLAFGLAVACADLVGVMRGAVQLACDYATHRQQYRVAIGSFQAVQHILADAHVATEGSRSVALHAAWAVDALGPSEALAAAALAKAYCARAARGVCEAAVQVHGGIGNTWECLAHVYLRRALLSSDLLGGAGASLDRVLTQQGIGAVRGLR
jgi:Acyl-CoA dehydrogenase, C-terminal domain